jgi:hypothetical protein
LCGVGRMWRAEGASGEPQFADGRLRKSVLRKVDRPLVLERGVSSKRPGGIAAYISGDGLRIACLRWVAARLQAAGVAHRT